MTIFPYLHLHQIPILNTIIPTPPPSTNVASQAQSQNEMLLDQVTSRTIQTANHLTSALHLIEYSHADIMRSQKNTNTGEHLNQPKKKKKVEIFLFDSRISNNYDHYSFSSFASHRNGGLKKFMKGLLSETMRVLEIL